MVISILMLACSSQSSSTTAPEPPDADIISPHALTMYASCDEVLAAARERAKNYVKERLESYFTCYDYGDDVVGIAMEDSADASTASSADFTETNVQEEGVDEADIIKSDGEYLYEAVNGDIHVWRIWPLTSFAKVSTISLSEQVQNLYLSGDQLVAISMSLRQGNLYDTKLSFFSVTNPASPSLLQEKEIEGWYVSSRLVNDVLHVVTTRTLSVDIEYPEYDGETYNLACDGDSVAQADLDALFAQTMADHAREIEAKTLADLSLSAYNCPDIAFDNDAGGMSLAIFSSVDLEQFAEKITVVTGRAHEVYSSPEGFYFVANDEKIDGTYVHRFDISGDDALHAYFGSGAVTGHINDSFSMSEDDGYFRIVTTYGTVEATEGSAMQNGLFILNAEKRDLPLVGSVTGFGNDERVYAARFIDDKAYVVTFQQVDPLFVIDLSDPQKPFIAGELEMPGFSTYLHPLGEDLLIGLGVDLNGGEWSWGIKLAIFSVADPSNPSIFDEEMIDDSYLSSLSMVYDHHAFTFDEDSGLLALPVTISEYHDSDVNAVYVYALSATTGVSVAHEIHLSEESSSPRRTFMIGDDGERGLYVLDADNIYLYEISDEAQLLTSFTLE